jgi:hypothetical protein
MKECDGGPGPLWAVAPTKKIFIYSIENIICIFRSCTVHLDIVKVFFISPSGALRTV